MVLVGMLHPESALLMNVLLSLSLSLSLFLVEILNIKAVKVLLIKKEKNNKNVRIKKQQHACWKIHLAYNTLSGLMVKGLFAPSTYSLSVRSPRVCRPSMCYAHGSVPP